MKILRSKLVIVMVTLTTLFSGLFLCTGALAAEGSSSLAEANTISQEKSYREYLQQVYKDHPNAAEPTQTYTQKGDQFTAFSSETDVKKLADGQIVTGEKGYVEYTFDVAEEGLYNIVLDYKLVIDDELKDEAFIGKRRSAVRSLYIDYEQEKAALEDEKASPKPPFKQAGSLYFDRIWKDVIEGGKFEVGVNQSDITPDMVEQPMGVQSKALSDQQGMYTEPFLFYFTKGQHTVRLASVAEPLIIDQISLTYSDDLISYTQYLAQYNQVPAGNAAVRFEAEMMSLKNSASLIPTYDRTSPATYPQDAAYIRLNTVGSNASWSKQGSWIEYEVNVPATGMYQLSMRCRQNITSGKTVNRKVYIDGEVPFKEAESVTVNYANGWQMVTFQQNESNPYYFYLTEGKHTVRFEVSMGVLAEVATIASDSLTKLNYAYRQFFMLTGSSPDQNRDYNFDVVTPEAIQILKDEYIVLDDMIKTIDGFSGKKGEMTQTLTNLQRVMKDMYTKPSNIAFKVTQFSDYVTAFGDWINDIASQPLEVDYFCLSQKDYQLEDVEQGGWSKFKFEVKKFYYSFLVDYNDFGSDDSGDSIVVWLGNYGGNREQAQLIKKLADEDFTPKTGIKVNMKMVAARTLPAATLANKGPDVSLMTDSINLMNYALRGAAAPLNEFEGYEEVVKQFSPSAMETLTFNGKAYGLPETEDFFVMFYRTDIMQELGLSIEDLPNTWDDVKTVIKQLQKKNMEFGMGNALDANIYENATSVFLTYVMFLYQNGGEIYDIENRTTMLNNKLAMEQFKDLSAYYTQWKLSPTYSFVSRFASGTMPIAIGNYSFYPRIQAYNPDLAGDWGIAMVPGTMMEDGSINRTVGNETLGAMITSKSEKKEASWEFMKWWTSEQAQLDFANEIEMTSGLAARHTTANVAAMKRMAWNNDTIAVLGEQWEHVKGIPQVPGSYYTKRNINFAFNDVVYESTDPTVAWQEQIPAVDAEVARKFEELEDILGLTD